MSPKGSNAADIVAPLPPRKPANVIAAQLAEAIAPTPPQRPAEFAFAPSSAKATGDEGAGDRDLIAALLQRGRLPRVITHGVGSVPPDVLALAETAPAPEPPDRPAMLARAAALAAPLPPIPPTRAPAPGAAKPALIESSPAQPSETSTASAKMTATAVPPTAPATRALAMLSVSNSQSKPANPYGELVYDAFKSAPEPRAAADFAQLLISSP